MLVLKRPAIAVALTAAALVAALAQQGSATAATCTQRTNIEVILDDSGSMSLFDPLKLRVEGMKLLLEKEANAKKTFGAVQFGTGASTVFAPGLPQTGLAAMKAALDAQINADDGSTDYNAAFTKAAQDNPNATARIFLTDGGHNAGVYAETHRGGPRTDVIGFGSSTQGEDGQRLARIAAETGGVYYPQTDASSLQATMNTIDAAYSCQSPPVRFSDNFTNLNEVKSHALSVGARTRSIDVVLTWAGAQNAFDLVSAKIKRGKRVVAKSSGPAVADSRRKRKPGKLRISRKVGATFVTVKISRVKRGKLTLRLKPKRLTLPTTLVTQVSKSSQR